jgi:hypothetical protein
MTSSEITDTRPKPFVFVLMPFAPQFIDVYEVGIKAASERAGAYCERVDEQHFSGSILERIYNQIAKADVIVAEMTGRNANVFYETGYAHALGKRVILLTANAADIPFDLQVYPHIVYGTSITKLRDELAARLEWAVSNPATTAMVDPVGTALVSIFGQTVTDGATVRARTRAATLDDLVNRRTIPLTTALVVDVQNRHYKALDRNGLHLTIELPKELPPVNGTSFVQQADGSRLIWFENENRMPPEGWASFSIQFQNQTIQTWVDHRIPLRLKLQGEFTSLESTFSLLFTSELTTI